MKVVVHTHQICNITQERNTGKSSRKQNPLSRIEYLCKEVSTIQLSKDSLMFLIRQFNYSYLLTYSIYFLKKQEINFKVIFFQ